MRMLLVFVALFAVSGVAYAETKTECGDRAYMVFRECLNFAEEVKGFEAGDMDLYSSWEMRDLEQQAETCLRFYKNKSRTEACRLRVIAEAIGTKSLDEYWEALSDRDRRVLEESGVTKEGLEKAWNEAMDEYRKK